MTFGKEELLLFRDIFSTGPSEIALCSTAFQTRSIDPFRTLLFFALPGAIIVGIYRQRLSFGRLAVAGPLLFAADFLIDASNQREFHNRGLLLLYRRSLH
jgi:hypothetical protein